MKKLNRKMLALLLRRAGIRPSKTRLSSLAAPAAYIDAAGARLMDAETAKLSPVGPLWRRAP